MSVFTDILTAMHGAHSSCRMAYTLRNKQPVLCTLLGNDPYFFDVDPDAVADHLDDVLGLEDAMFPIPESLRLARTTSEGYVTLGDGDDNLLLTDDLADLCRDAFKPTPALDINEALALLDFSSTGALLRDRALAAGVVIQFDDTVQGVSVDPKHDLVRINRHLTCESAVLLLIRELRRMQLNDVVDTLKNPESAILIHRALQAELLTVPVQVAWELSLSGHKAAWDLLSASPLADLTYAFGHRASADFRALRDGRAAMAAFDQWFYSGRTRKADRALIQCLLSITDDIAVMPMAGQANLTIETLRSIGERGIGRNYLIDHMMMLTQDGFYGDVRDRSNANFLWFVKFERSYRIAEAHMEEQQKNQDEDIIALPQGAVILSFPDLLSQRVKGSSRRRRQK